MGLVVIDDVKNTSNRVFVDIDLLENQQLIKDVIVKEKILKNQKNNDHVVQFQDINDRNDNGKVREFELSNENRTNPVCDDRCACEVIGVKHDENLVSRGNLFMLGNVGVYWTKVGECGEPNAS